MTGLARYLMIGGFLGAGKTTAMIELARYLHGRGRRVGLITNDQSVDLVDTARVKAAGFAVEEITGGCFCCRFDSLVAAADRLNHSTAPDVFIAEPVGSCTDLKATVAYPLRRLYGGSWAISPLSVMADPARCRQALGLDGRPAFSEQVSYIYRKQLEEAEIIVINKIDLLDASSRGRLRAELERQFPQAQVREVSCLTGENMTAWFDEILNGALGGGHCMEMDYDLYADGEALLGWVNLMASLSSPQPFDGNQILFEMAGQVRRRLAMGGVQIAHLKLTLSPSDRAGLAAVSLTGMDAAAQVTHELDGSLSAGVLTLNLRAEADPEQLKNEALSALEDLSPLQTGVMRVNAFRPGRPNPTHRMAGATA